jgi:hypothetical protein
MRSSTRLYLDIDGVLLAKRPVAAAPGAAAFIRFVTRHFSCCWLTTHCRGDTAVALRYLAPYVDPDTLACLQTWQATDWDTLKTEALNGVVDFYWLDDAPFESEQRMLAQRGLLHRLITVDLLRPDELPQLQQLLARLSG